MNGTDNNIEAEGARMISEVLKFNSTLTKMNLRCDKKNDKERKERKQNNE